MTTTAGALSMPPAGSDLHTTWAYLEDGLDYIMTKLPQGTSYSNYMGLYTVIYNYTSSAMVESGESAGQAQGSMCLRFKRDLAKDGLNPAGYDLYHRLSRYFGCHLKNLLEVGHMFPFFLALGVSNPSNVHSHPTDFKARSSYGSMRRNGIDTQRLSIISIESLHTSTNIGSKVRDM